MTRSYPKAYFFTLLTLAIGSAIIGWLIPYFYNWTDSDQSRPSPLLWIVPAAAGVVAGLFCCALPWLPIKSQESVDTSPEKKSFRVREILAIITVVAIPIPLLATFPTAAGIVVFTIAFLNFIWQVTMNPQSRLPALTFLACMFLPFAWISGYEELKRILPTVLLMIPCLPAFFPAGYLGAAIGVDLHNSHWIALLLTGIEITLGIWMIRLGPKRAVAFTLLAILISTFSSVWFYQLCRA